MIHFEHPLVFVTILLIPLLYVLRSLGVFAKLHFFLTLSDWNGKTYEWKSLGTRFARLLSRVSAFVGFACLVCALADPMQVHQEKVFTTQGTEIMFVIDISPSMAARDMEPKNRLNGAKVAIRRLVDNVPGASFGIVSMALESALVVPATTDHAVFLERLDNLVIGELGDGTAIGTGLSTGVYHALTSSAPKKALVLLTDGENNAGSIHPHTAASLAKQNAIDVYVVGLGTRGTVPVEYVDPKTGKIFSGYLESDFDDAVLQSLALAGGGEYYQVADTMLLAGVLSDIASKQAVSQSYYMKTVEKPLYYYFLYASFAFFAFCWIVRRLYLQELV